MVVSDAKAVELHYRMRSKSLADLQYEIALSAAAVRSWMVAVPGVPAGVTYCHWHSQRSVTMNVAAVAQVVVPVVQTEAVCCQSK